MLKNDYGMRFKSARLAAGKTQKEFAAALGVSFVTVSSWENGKSRPKERMIYEKIADMSGFHIDYLYGLSNHEHGSMIVSRLADAQKNADAKQAKRDALIYMLNRTCNADIVQRDNKTYELSFAGRDPLIVDGYTLNKILDEIIENAGATIENVYFMIHNSASLNKP